MEIPHWMDKHNAQSQSCSAHKLPEKDGPSLVKNEQICFCPNSLYEQCEQANVAQLGSQASTEIDFIPSESLSTSAMMKLCTCDPMLEHKKLMDLPQKDSEDLAASLADVGISKPSGKFYDQRNGYDNSASADSRTPFDDRRINNSMIDISGKQLVPSTNGVEHSGGRNVADRKVPESSVRTKERKLSLVVDEPVSLADVSSKNRFLSILNSFPPKVPMPHPRKKLLILDINGILADIVYPPPKGYKADIKIAGRAVFTRPHCYDFFNFCLERFHVGIWSSRSKKIVDRVLQYLIGDMKERLSFCWDISHCTISQFRTLENRHKALVFKELRKLWENYDSDLPWDRSDYSESNTLLVDDSPYKALLNPPHTAIFPYSFSFKDHADNSIGPEGNIRAYLEELAMAENVQKYIEEHPFGQSAITERSMSWPFYNKVIERQYTNCYGS